MMKKNNKTTLTVLLIAAALVVVLLLDIWQVFRLTSDLTLSAGRYHLESISGELESTIRDAEQHAMRLAISAQPFLGDREAIRRFVYTRKAQLVRELCCGIEPVLSHSRSDKIIPCNIGTCHDLFVCLIPRYEELLFRRWWYLPHAVAYRKHDQIIWVRRIIEQVIGLLYRGMCLRHHIRLHVELRHIRHIFAYVFRCCASLTGAGPGERLSTISLPQ